jgi:hypothetical protein
VGGKELKNMIRSAGLLHGMLKGSTLETREGLYHGEFSINCPEAYAGKVLELTGMESQ